MEFYPIEIEKQQVYQTYLEKCGELSSDYSFANLFGWKEAYCLSWAFTEKLVFIRQQFPSETYWAPVGDWAHIDWRRVMATAFNGPGEFIRVPESLFRIWETYFGDTVKGEETRGMWDYIYSAEDVITLKGNKFHKKRNLVAQFKKKYDYTYLPMEKDLVGKTLDLQENWCTWRDCDSSASLSAENQAIETICRNWEHLYGITGGALMVDDRMVAYTIAEMITPDTLLIHFEKGDAEFKGVYQAINQIFLEHMMALPENENIRFVNREPDLDDDGLRKAKLSYHPVTFIKKFQSVVG